MKYETKFLRFYETQKVILLHEAFFLDQPEALLPSTA